ncbi:MAG: thioredoxin family protein [Opitutae bacterium]|nr:thioredoxin family protein [Opitutae bacterium]
MGPDIFDTHVDGAVLISSAFAQARTSGKQVLLLVSANWCPWTRRLHSILHGTPALQRRLNERYVLVYLDANTRRDRQRNASVLARLGDPQKRFGIPVFVLLDADGKVAETRETQSIAAPDDAEVATRLSRLLLVQDD